MPEVITQGLAALIRVLEICGASLLILGFVIATWNWLKRLSGAERHTASSFYRQSLGRAVLIGLEVLVAATIIKTVIVAPSVEGLGLLAGMIVIRTILGWTTTLEINGRWPWQKPRSEAAPRQAKS